MKELNAIERVIAILGGHYGGQSELARKVNVTPQSVQRWVAAGEVPVKRVIAVESAVEGRVTRYELCPEIFGDAPDGQSNAA